MPKVSVSRRSFLNTLGGTAIVAATPGFARIALAEPRKVALVATSDSIHTMEAFGSGWRSRHSVAAELPRAMALSADGSMLYVANATELYNGLPTGSVTGYSVAADGSLRKTGTAQLALSARRPHAVAVCPNGSLLAAASEGGVVSVLTLHAEGHPGQVIAAHKVLTAEPLKVEFDADALLHIADGTVDRVFRISPRSGLEQLSSQPVAARQAASLDGYGIANVKAVVCLSA